MEEQRREESDEEDEEKDRLESGIVRKLWGGHAYAY